jgi:hypothetical protein
MDQKEKLHKEWIDYRNSVSDNKSKSQDDFEKYINLMASGGIILSITFMEKIVTIDKAICKYLIVLGMFLMVATLLSNLYSHYKSMLDCDATIRDIDYEKYDAIFKNIEKRNKVINRLNRTSIWSLIIGIILIISFATINIYTMNYSNQNGKPTPNPQTKPATEEKGRTIPTPPKNNPTNYPKK